MEGKTMKKTGTDTFLANYKSAFKELYPQNSSSNVVGITRKNHDGTKTHKFYPRR